MLAQEGKFSAVHVEVFRTVSSHLTILSSDMFISRCLRNVIP